MPVLTVSPDQRPGFEKLLRLDERSLSELVEALEKAPLRLYQTELARAVGERVQSIPVGDVEEIVAALWPVEFLRVSLDAPYEPYLDDVAEGLVRAGLATSDRIAKFRPSLERLVRSEALSMSAKARALLTDGNSYCGARVLTDVRPVFPTEGVDAPRAALIVHHLTLTYHANAAETQDTVISLDSGDINDLMNVLERAKAKQQKLEALLRETKLPYLDSE